MANTKQATKRARQAEKRRQNNRWQKTRALTHVKHVIEAIQKGDKELATTAYRAASSILDRLAQKGIIHKNKAARHKSRLNGHVKAMTVPA